MYIKLFVGNLPWRVDDGELAELFREHGDVQSARVINDRTTGRSRGFGFVEMEVSNPATLIEQTNGLEIDGRQLRVNEAEERNRFGSASRRGGGGGGAGGGGGRGSFRGGGGGQRW
jgi:RNA recognition motif-containing protein